MLVTVFFFTLIFHSLAKDVEYQQLWTGFRQSYNKNYLTPEEEGKHYQIFVSNVDFIDRLNLEHNPRTFFGINQFADMTNQELMSYFNHPDFKKSTPHSHHLHQKRSSPRIGSAAIPDSVDWREKGAVTPIGNQGQCGSSPYWSAVVSMEGAWAIAGHPLVNLSVQQIDDCSNDEGNYGCDGGEMTSSFEYIIKSGGAENAQDYPYTAVDGTCHFDAQKIIAKFSSYKVITAGDEAALTEALSIVPVATAVNAADPPFQFYQSGIYDSSTCNQPPCHGIGIVGYGSNAEGDFYILKNTWGTTWGMEGYMLLARNKGNMCSVATDATYIVV
jgi:cathepsin L